MMPIAISHYPTAEEVAEALIRKQNVREINTELKKLDYSLEKITEYLETEKREFLPCALLDATEERYVDINTEKGKTIWRTVFEFYKNEGLKEELYDAQDRLYMLTAASRKQKWLDFKADGIAALCKAATLGILMASPIIKDIRSRAYKKYFTKFLYPDNWKEILKNN